VPAIREGVDLSQGLGEVGREREFPEAMTSSESERLKVMANIPE
jgi:hypothetical protein